MRLIDQLKKLNIDMDKFYSVSSDVSKHYRLYKIKKKKGSRLICEPSPELMEIQRALNKAVFFNFKVSKHTRAYEQNCSILANAISHFDKVYFLKLDIKDFFRSIKYAHVEKLLRKRYKPEEIELIWKLVSFEGALPIGAPSSPFIANRIMIKADKKIAKCARKCVYTRYADDLVFSSYKPIDKGIFESVQECLREFDFRINRDKISYSKPGFRRSVTGIVVSDENKLTVGHRYKAKLKNDIYNFIKKRKGNPYVIKGKIAFVKSIEPDYYNMLARKYKLRLIK